MVLSSTLIALIYGMKTCWLTILSTYKDNVDESPENGEEWTP